MKYRQEWYMYVKEFGSAGMSYDQFVRMMHREEQDYFFKDLARQAVEMDKRNKEAKEAPAFVGAA